MEMIKQNLEYSIIEAMLGVPVSEDISIQKFETSVSRHNSRTVDAMGELEADIMTTLKQLHSERLIQKISRPNQKQEKLRLIAKFSHKLSELHLKMKSMQQINFDGYFKIILDQQKQKKRRQNIIQIKLIFFTIRKKYIEVLINSNLALYKRISALVEIQYDLSFIDIESWLSLCLQKLERKGKSSHILCCQ